MSASRSRSWWGQVPSGGGGHQSAAAQHRDQALTCLVGLFQVRVAGQDEFIDAEPVVLGDAFGHLVVAADQGRARTAADQADASPQVRGYLQGVDAPAMQR